MRADISKLTEEQRAQVEMQWIAMQHGFITIPFEELEIEQEIKEESGGESHKTTIGDFIDFDIFPGVWDPTKTCAKHFVRYLAQNSERLCKGKKVLDLACGTGIQGLVALLLEAEFVFFSDISDASVANTKTNLYNYHVFYGFPNNPLRGTSIVAVENGDLFEALQENREYYMHFIKDCKFDTILFNQPFFDGTPSDGDTIEASMLDSGELLQRFLREALEFLSTGGVIVMPWYTKASDTNNPFIQGQKHGYEVREGARIQSTEGLQQGEILIYELMPRKV